MDGQDLQVVPYFAVDTAYLPLRQLANLLGVQIHWDQTSEKIILTQDQTVNAPAGEKISGTIVEINRDERGLYFVQVKGKGTALDELVAIVSGETTIENAAEDVERYAPDLAVGMKVTVHYGPAVTMSLPAQSAAHHLTIESLASLTLEDTVKTGTAGTVTYPVVSGHAHTEKINARLEKEATALADASYFEELVASFRITRVDDRVLSGVFGGTASAGSRDQWIARPLSIDLTSGKVIDFENAVKNEEDLRTLIGEQVVSRGLADVFEAEGIWLYFEGENIIFQYYPLDDSVDRPVVIDLPVETVEPYLVENNW
jgi:hypothetical protein